jgi:hypothetical protein
MPRGLAIMLFAITMLGVGSAPALGDPIQVKVDILVIEAKKDAGTFDARLEKLEKRIVRSGYQSATVLDELNAADIAIGSSVSLEMPSKKQDLKVKVLDVAKDKKIKLQVGIKGMKFETETEHSDGGMLLVVITKGDNALMLAVTPAVQR